MQKSYTKSYLEINNLPSFGC